MILSGINLNDQEVIKLIIGKNCKIGMDSGINKALGKLLETTPYMGGKSFTEKGVKKIIAGGNAFSQIKMDGTYRNCIIQNGTTQLLSRQGEISYLMSAKFLEELSLFPDGVLNGELTIDGYERKEGNGMCNSIMDIIEKSEERGEIVTNKKIAAFEAKHGSYVDALANMRYTIWDRLTLHEYSNPVGKIYSKRKYSDRFDTVKEILDEVKPTKVKLVESRKITTYAEAMDHFLTALKDGLEGTFVKDGNGEWKDGKPVYQCKMKLEISLDLRIIGFNYGTVGTKNEHVISVLELESACGQLKTSPGGMSELMMDDVTNRQEELLGTIVEIRCCGLSKNSKGENSTDHPSVVELRTDKDTCDDFNACIEIENMAKGLIKEIK